MNGGITNHKYFFRRKMLAPAFLAVLAILHLSLAWAHPLPAAAATLAPHLQITFLPDINPVDIGDQASFPLNPDHYIEDSALDPLAEEPSGVQGRGFISVLPKSGTTELGYAYERRDGRDTIHIWVDGQVTIVDANDPENHILIEEFKLYTAEYEDVQEEIREGKGDTLLDAFSTGALMAGFALSGVVAAASCVGMIAGGVTLPLCLGSLGLTVVDGASLAIQSVRTIIGYSRVSDDFQERRELHHMAQEISLSLQSIINRNGGD